jgi:hypothetical protein
MCCWFFRLMISGAADSDKQIGPLTSRHMAHCASCRQFHQSCRVLDEGLRSEAADPGRTTGLLTARILAGLTKVRPRRRRLPAGAVFAAAACVALAALAGVLVTQNREPPEPPSPSPPVTLAGTYPAITWPGLIESPLETEVKKITSNTESGIRFLVACLNVNPLGGGMTPPSDPHGPIPTP